MKRFLTVILITTLLLSAFGVKIGEVTCTMRHEFFQALHAGIVDAANEIGAEVMLIDPELSIEKQIQGIEDLIEAGVDAIIVIAITGDTVVPVVEEAAKKGIVVVAVDEVIPSDKVVTFVGTPNFEAGKKLGDLARKYIQTKLAGKKVKIAVVRDLGSTIQAQRTEGFLAALRGLENVEFVGEYQGYDRDKAFATVSDLLVAHPDLSIIYAPAENAVVGAFAALETMGRSDVKIFGFDMTEEAVRGIKKDVILGMAQQQPYLLGVVGMQSAMIKLIGKKTLGSDWLPPKRLVPVKIYTPENINEYSPPPTKPSSTTK